DEIFDVLPAEIEGISNKKGLFNVIVLPEQVNNYKGPFNVVKVTCEDRILSPSSGNQGISSKSKEAKEQIGENADEVNLISDALLTPRKMNSNTSNAVNLMDDDHVKRKLIDEFSSNTQKRNKEIGEERKIMSRRKMHAEV
ncbi:hypothetical protein C2S52_006998, partial [Perilla frutescens var. hirtella]